MKWRPAILLAIMLLCMCSAALADQLAILDTPEDAIIGRIYILDAAETSVDVLYFSIHDDSVTRATLGLLREKALAGVNVRMATAAAGFKVDPALLYHLHSLEGFEIRLYNKKMLGFNRQLHDKMILVDGEHYITGGRNLGEVYFDRAEQHNKKDRDIYVSGNSAQTAQSYFDDLWDSSEVTAVDHEPYTIENMESGYCEARGKDPVTGKCAKRFAKRTAEVDAAIESLEAHVARAKANAIYEVSLQDPTPYLVEIPDEDVEFLHDPVEAANTHVDAILTQLAEDADGEILLQSPYVVPNRDMFELLERKQQEGVPITFVTNSIKSTINVVGYAGYARYRKRMLDLGVTFIESTGDHMLHAKSSIFRWKDGTCVAGIGSFNIDPRSANLNTETYVLVRDCDFADELEEIINSYGEDGVVLSSRDDIKKLKPVKKETPKMKRFMVSVLKCLTPLYRWMI